MPQKIIVGFDGSEAARRALDFAVNHARGQGDSIILAHVLEWSPYSFLTPTELEERHKRRKEELERANSAIIAPVVAKVESQGIPVSSALKYGLYS